MSFIHATMLDEVHLHVRSSNSVVEKELKYLFSLHPQATSKKNDEPPNQRGIYRLYDPDKDKRNLYIGLFPRLEKFARENGHTIRRYRALEVTKSKKPIEPMVLGPFEEWEDFYEKDIRKSIPNEERIREAIGKWRVMHEIGKNDDTPFDPPFYSYPQEHETTAILNKWYQKREILSFIHENRKHLVIACFLRLCIVDKKRCLFLAVDKTAMDDLYECLNKSFPKERRLGKFCMGDHIQRLYEDPAEKIPNMILLADWKAVKTQSSKWFDQFDVVIAYEVNKFSRLLIPLMEKIAKTKHRIGIMDTTENLKIHPLVLEGLFGPIEEVWEAV